MVALPGLYGGSGMLQFGITAKSELSSGIAQAYWWLGMLQELPCLNNLINMKLMLASALEPCVHDMISGFLFHAVRVELCWCQLFSYLWGVQ